MPENRGDSIDPSRPACPSQPRPRFPPTPPAAVFRAVSLSPMSAAPSLAWHWPRRWPGSRRAWAAIAPMPAPSIQAWPRSWLISLRALAGR
ncbi:hypothetical protein G6F63_015731 [Rhizopus arrhizus]|nr:hypothetical protein G6F63_015731 [Rhizopus arrhizus]